MHSQALFGIIIAIGLLLTILFLWRRTSGVQKPNRLHLKRQSTLRNVPATISKEAMAESKVSPNEKNLNVLFMYNGHSFDAHEVLGLPAGANRKMIEEAYRATLAKVDLKSQEFIKAAYQALLTNLS